MMKCTSFNTGFYKYHLLRKNASTLDNKCTCRQYKRVTCYGFFQKAIIRNRLKHMSENKHFIRGALLLKMGIQVSVLQIFA
jgi:hypothetical protein